MLSLDLESFKEKGAAQFHQTDEDYVHFVQNNRASSESFLCNADKLLVL